jgi:outer membrane protein assembly factor BamA
MHAVFSARAGAIVAPITAAPPSAGRTVDPAPEPVPVSPLPQAGLDNVPASQTVPVTGPRPSNAPAGRLPSDEELVASGAVIGDVVIRNENIFDTTDPREDNWLFRAVNKLHVKTRPWLIRDQLLFRTGDAYDRRVLDESERILRSNRYFYDARIRPIAFHEGRVDVEVLTRDVWTLRPGISFGRQGGANSTSINISELNLFGTGAGITFSHASTPDRNMDSVSFASTHVAGTWLRTELLYSDNSDGRERSALLERPFYALDTRWASGASFVDDLRVDTLYGRVGVASEFQTHAKKVNAYGGWSDGLKGRWVKRFTFGFTQDESRFAPAPGNVPSDPIPPDRILAYPWVGFELVEDAFEKAKNRDQIERTEDFFLGTRFQASLGYSSSIFGADRDAAVFSGQFGTGFKTTDSSTLLVDTSAAGRVESGSVHDTTLSAGGRLYIRLSKSFLLFSTLSGSMGINLDQDHEFVLGGENGLRGYPRNYQAGDRSALFTLEGRYFSSLYLFRLVRIGGAAFYDMGRAWGENYVNAQDAGILRDVGFGLRLAMTRSGLGNVIHVDLAFPLDGDPTISRMQYLVTTKQSF